MALTIAELKAIASLDTAKFEAGTSKIGKSTKQAQSEVDRAGQAISATFKKIGAAAAAAFTVGAVISFEKQLLANARAAKNAGDALNVSAGTMAEVMDMAEQMGMAGEDAATKWAKLIDSQDAAYAGNKQLQKSFEGLGISMEQLASMSPEEMLMAVARGAQKDANALSDLNDVLGKGAGRTARPLLNELNDKGMPSGDKKTMQLRAQVAVGIMIKKKQQELQDAALAAQLELARAAGVTDTEVSNQMGQDAMAKRNEDILAARGRQSRKAAARAEKVKDINDASDASRLDILTRDDAAIRAVTVRAPEAADRLAKFGGIVGNQTAMGQGAAERQLKLTEITNKTLADLAKLAEQTNQKLEALEE